MELNFDKEMDAILRQAARGGEFLSGDGRESAHPDADEIAAFAENAVPEKARGAYVSHFADCDRCRTILSNVILLNSEAEPAAEKEAVTAAAPVAAETRVPWYRRLFLMPNLAYTMGALVLVFGAMLGFLVLQNVNQGGLDVAQSPAGRSAERIPSAAEEPDVQGNAATANAAANASAAPANTSVSSTDSTFDANTAANVPTLQQQPSASNSASATSPSEIETADAQRDEKKQKSLERKETELKTSGIDVAENRPPAKTAEERADTVKGEAAKQEDEPRLAAAAPPPPAAAPAPMDDAKAPESSTRAKKAARVPLKETRQIGGKTFNRTGGVWIDSDYSRSSGPNRSLPPVRNVRRGSDEYRQLDKQVRIIAESLDGPVIVVWKDRAYRIQ